MANYIGVDIGKQSLQIYFSITDKSFEITNSKTGFSKLTTLITKNYDLSNVIIVFEPTGGYEKAFREYLKQNKINYSIVHPNKVRNFARSKGLLAKTDKLDSKLLYDYASAFNIEIKAEYNTDAQEKLQKLIKRREQLILLKNQEIARLELEDDLLIIQSLNEHLSCLKNQFDMIEQNIEDLCQNAEIKDKVDRLTSIPAVGMVLATTVVCELPELGNMDFNKLTALVGLAPFARDSGNYSGKRSIFAGRGNLRKILYMAAISSLRCNKKLKSFYDRLIANHKPPKVALVAVMRKLLAIMNALFKNNTYWHYEPENL